MNPSRVFQGDARVATMTRLDGGIRFEYDPDVALARGRLSTAIGPEPRSFTESEPAPFFLNLLPEGARLEMLLDSARSRDDALELLNRVGWDTVGDVAVIPGDDGPTGVARAFEGELRDASFWDLFYGDRVMGDDAALPGVQEKISAATVAFGVRLRHVPSAILKLSPKRFPRLVENEMFWLRVAARAGLDVNRAKVVTDRHGERGLLVTRFDRQVQGGKVVKRHQEDGCQLLNVAPALKYRVTYQRLVQAVSQFADAPKLAALRAMQLYTFSYAIGNGDLHAKNVSLLWADTVRVSPLYDLLSTAPYALDDRMALPLFGKDDRFSARFLVESGVRLGVSELAMRRAVGKIVQAVTEALGRVDEIGLDEDSTAKMVRLIESRLRRLQTDDETG
ncbi:MAG: HipA domain-containing protein [Fimbriimonadaceae bacterium]|nr:HipA domain-containing protein [Fimbriimonadaceae bacterium]